MQMTQGLQRSLQQTPQLTATVFGGRRRSFREFAERVARLAGALQHLDVRPGDRVGILALNSDRYLEVLMATWWAGAVLNPVNIRWSVPEIVYSLDDCDTRLLFVDDRFAPLADAIRASARHAPRLIHLGEEEAPQGMLCHEHLIAHSAPIPDARRADADLACIMYTGGTTGFPKGVIQTHRNLWCGSLQRIAAIPPLRDSVLLHSAPLFHIGALSRAMMQFVSGGTHVIVPGFEASELLRTIERERINELALVPTMIQALIAHPDFGRTDLSSVKRLSYGASPIPPTVLEDMMRALPGVEFFHQYGLTEACPIVSVNPPENHGEQGRALGLSGSAGRAVPGVEVKIVDGGGRELPPGSVGEIVVRGPNITLGYWNKPAETAAALRDGWLHTGDGAWMDEAGHLFVVDRIKDMIVTGGENVYSAEVEGVIGRHPAVAMCAVIGIPHPTWVEAVHAVVVLRPGASLSEDDLRAHCRESIAGYKCPKSVEFRGELPLSGAGKVLKRELRDAHWPARAPTAH
ncbi:long-chain fatty acid--CoA ligase [Variovorax sp. J22P168]|uniref:acyl-CoA synthetase n=1 Tax=Variovorax jilinensis TaxID=3053513 RepID=UPI0025768E12|nr:long-chain fatty acid--CoA ligase [Variovorax sp. J22P168]MDM0015275.1 long-chain fatty acid--CoA ligase [Variovorax sp. J22P168]